jgi:hypothetical protein
MNDRDLIYKAAGLARSAPQAWNDFLGALAQYTEQHRSNCISSSVENLQVAQGRAQAYTNLLRLLQDCKTTADKIEGKQK